MLIFILTPLIPQYPMASSCKEMILHIGYSIGMILFSKQVKSLRFLRFFLSYWVNLFQVLSRFSQRTCLLFFLFSSYSVLVHCRFKLWLEAAVRLLPTCFYFVSTNRNVLRTKRFDVLRYQLILLNEMSYGQSVSWCGTLQFLLNENRYAIDFVQSFGIFTR